MGVCASEVEQAEFQTPTKAQAPERRDDSGQGAKPRSTAKPGAPLGGAPGPPRPGPIETADKKMILRPKPKDGAASARGRSQRKPKENTAALQSGAMGQSTMLPAAEPMPSEAEVNRRFRELMEERLVPPDKIDMMLSVMPAEKRWGMVAESKKLTRSKPAEEWVKVLFSPDLQARDLKSMRIEIQSAGRAFLEEWVASQGLRALLQKLASPRVPMGVRVALGECLTAFANNEFGIHTLLHFPNAVHTICGVLVTGDSKLKQLVIRLLIALAYDEGSDVEEDRAHEEGVEDGLEAVLDALSNPKMGKRFRVLVDILADEKEHLGLRTDAAVLLNTVVISTQDIERRIEFRLELLDMDYTLALDKMDESVARIKSKESKEYATFHAQYVVFHEEMKSDSNKVLYEKIDTSDIEEVMGYMRHFAHSAGHTHDLLRILHPMMLIPTNNSGDRTWRALKHIVMKACTWFESRDETESDEDEIEEPPQPLTYQELVTSLREFKSEDRKAEEKQAREIEKLRSDAHSLKKRVSTLMSDLKSSNERQASRVADLERKLKQASAEKDAASKRDAEIIKGLEARLKTAEDNASGHQKKHEEVKKKNILGKFKAAAKKAVEHSTLKEKIELQDKQLLELKQKLADALAKADSVSKPLATTPIPTQGVIPPPPGAAVGNGVSEPPSTGIVPPPPGMAGGVPPPPGMAGGVPPPPGMAGGVPPPPGLGAMPAMIAVPAKPVVKMPYEKRELTVKSKMKVFHWNRIQNEKILGTCWAKLTDQNVSIDEAGFAQLFGKRKRKKAGVAVDKDKSKMGAAAGGPKRRKKREVVTLVDSKRSYNIGIALARFKMPPEAIRDALLQMDGAVLNEDRITTLLKCKPTSDEIALVKSYDGDTEALGPTEKFFLKLSEIPEVNFRIESFLFRVRFDRVVSEVQDMIDAMNLATGTLKESQRFFSVLEFVLALGNYMNNGRPNGAAYGVKLNSLNKLRGVKTTDGKSNLLEYVVQMFEGSDAKRDKLQFVDEFDAVKDAQRIDISYMKTSVAKTVGMVNRIGRAVEKSPDSTADRYKPVMSEFHSYASERVGQLNDACNAALDKVNDLVRYFGEDAKRTSTAEFFAFFTSFADSVRKTRAILAKKKEVEERQRRREAAEHEKKEAKQKRREEKKKRVKKPRKIKKNIVGAVVGTLRVADADKIRAAFRKRQKMGTLRFSNAAGVPRKRSSNARKRVKSSRTMAQFEANLLAKIKASGRGSNA